MPRTTAIAAALALGLGANLAGAAEPEDFRPPGAPKGKTLAAIRLVRGAAKVRAGGQDFPAASGFQLVDGDLLRVPPAGQLVLQLHNDYVVVMDEDLDLLVHDLALLNAPRTSAPFEQQIQALIESRQIREADRVIGFKSQRLAADSSAEHAPEAQNAKNDSAPPPPPPAPAPHASKPANSPAHHLSKPVDSPAPHDASPVKSSEEVSRLKEEAMRKGAAASIAWTRKPGKAESPAPKKLAALVTNLASRLQEAVPAEVRAGYRSDRLRLSVKAGKVVRVALASALPPPACLTELVGLDLAGTADGLYEIALEVPAK